MGNLLEVPKTDKETEHYVTSEGLIVGSSAMQGWRLEMEDSHILIDMPSRPDHSFFAVFDGHGGAGAAAYAAKNMIHTIQDTSFWKDYLKGGASDINCLQKALKKAFFDMDVALRDFQSKDHDRSGCTSVTAMITPKYIICANAGDSRCVLGTCNSFKAMSEDHKPNNELEQKRIELAGGRVQWKRIDGDLAVSRGFGDFQYKTRKDLGPAEQMVSCDPEFVIHERCPGDEALLLACDGLWDVLDNSEAIAGIRRNFSQGKTLMTDVAENMLDVSLSRGSKDNISVIVVKLPGAKITIPPEHNESSSTSTKDDDENMREMGSPPDRDL